MAVRKNFNSAAVSETDVVVGLVYKVRHQGEFWTFGTSGRSETLTTNSRQSLSDEIIACSCGQEAMNRKIFELV